MMRLTFLMLAVACNSAVWAQKDIPGFIVTSEKDTITGIIQDRTDAELASGIIFKRTNDVKGYQYASDSIHSFGFNYGRTFSKFPLKTTRSKKDSMFVFAKRTVEGKISIYTYSKEGQGQPDMFLINNHTGDSAHLSPPTKVRKVNKDGRTVDVSSNIYLGAIKILKGDTLPDQKIKRTRYTEKAIRRGISRSTMRGLKINVR